MKRFIYLLTACITITGIVGCKQTSTMAEDAQLAEVQEITGSTAMLSASKVLSSLGYDINTEKTSGTLYASKRKTVIAITPDSDIATVNDTEYKMNATAKLVDGDLQITAAALSEFTGKTVNDDGSVYDEDDNETEKWTKKVDVNLSTLTSKTYSITEGGVYTLTGEYNGMIYVNTEDKVKLVLNGVTITSPSGPAIYFENSKKGIIEAADGSTNILTDSTDYTVDAKGCIFSNDDLEFKGSGSITVNAGYNHGIVSDDDIKIEDGTITVSTSIGDAIHTKGGVRIDGGTLTLTAKGDGISGDEYVEVNEGNVSITTNGEVTEVNEWDDAPQMQRGGGHRAPEDGEQPEMPQGEQPQMPADGKMTEMPTGSEAPQAPTEQVNDENTEEADEDSSSSSKGIKSDSLITINGGTINVSAADHCVKSDNLIVINGGTINLSSEQSKGIKALGCIFINDGTLSIDTGDEGMESKATATINGGTVDIVSGDDGINAGGGSGTNMVNNVQDGDEHQVIINGGKITIDADGDGIDSNGNIYVYGGEVFVNGSEGGGDSALDSAANNEVYGGTLLAVGSADMAECPAGEGQNVFNITLDESKAADSTLKITNSSGEVLFENTVPKAYQSIIFSSADIKAGESYTVYVDNEQAATVTAQDGVTQSGTRTGGDNMGHGGGMKGERRDWQQTTATQQ